VLADNPQDTVRELRVLVVEYAKQETVEPIKGLGKYAGFGIGGAALLGLGTVFFAIGLLRLLQDETGTTFTGAWSWVPYVIVIAVSILIAAIVWMLRGKRKRKASDARSTK
jgi:hypothetical protein